ncbi:MAG: IS1634 family transposase [Candidatus Ozemobacteraceae bacterium]
MATFQKRNSRGHAYWSIVESRRINGKPRPVILEYLGTADAFLEKLRNSGTSKVRSYFHGNVSALLKTAQELNLVQILNRYVPQQQMRDGLTVGASLFLAALGRACRPTSKRAWHSLWAKTTSLSHILKMNLRRLDSQHFWDQMDAFPVDKIPLAEEEIIKALVEKFELKLDTVFCDMTNFFTYIASTNERCTIAKRGKNKQKRADLKQFGMALLASKDGPFPLFHDLYQGNLNDKTVFKERFDKFLKRLKTLAGSLEKITLVFDQGCNSKAMLGEVKEKIKFVGALSPIHHKKLIAEANIGLIEENLGDRKLKVFRTKKKIWGRIFSTVVYVSPKLKAGQIRALEKGIKTIENQFDTLQKSLLTPSKKKKEGIKENIEKKILGAIKKNKLPEGLIIWRLEETPIRGCFRFRYKVSKRKLKDLKENKFGRRILITNRHDWSNAEIMRAYWGQSCAEYLFERIKNPFFLGLRPQYHWTDQKIHVHGFICMLACILVMATLRKAQESGFKGSVIQLMSSLAEIRLATILEKQEKGKRGRFKVKYCFEEMEKPIKKLADGLLISENTIFPDISLSVY